jgi:hypothetical protein
LPWVEQHKRPSTHKGYKDVWEDYLKPLCSQEWLKNTRTYVVQQWLSEIGKPRKLSRDSLRHVKSVISGIFALAKQLNYFQGANLARDTAIDLEPLMPKKRMHTRWTRCRQSSRCYRNPLPPHLQSRRSWDWGTARFKGCCGRTTLTVRFTSLARSGMGTSRGTQDSQGPCADPGHSAVGGAARTASASPWQSAVGANLRQLPREAA